jgi:hypothetical protein
MPAGFAPNIVAEAVRPLGRRPLPQPIRQVPDRFFSGADNGALIEVTGVVRGVYEEPRQWRIVAETSLRTFEVEIRKALMPADFGSKLDNLADASVQFVGVAATAFNVRGEFLWPRLCLAKPEWLTGQLRGRDRERVVLQRPLLEQAHEQPLEIVRNRRRAVTRVQCVHRHPRDRRARALDARAARRRWHGGGCRPAAASYHQDIHRFSITSSR